MKKAHKLADIHFDGDTLVLKIDGERNEFSLRDISKPLFQASKIERNTFKVSPSGYGINWTLIDEDLSIDGLLGVVHMPKEKTKVT